MTKTRLKNAIEKNKISTHDALQLVVDTLNQGQRKKLAKDELVAMLFERYDVEI